MRKGILAFVLGLCVWGSAVAADLPEGELVVTLADGTIVGVGELEDGGLELELLAGTSGFVTFTVTGDDGAAVSFEVALGEDGSLVLVESFEDLAGTIAAAGGEVEVSFEEAAEFEAIAAEAGDGPAHATGLDRADEKASENAAEGLARARAARDGDATTENEAEEAEEADEAAEEAERAAEEAERAAEEAEEAAERAAEEAEEATEGDEQDDEGEEDDDETAEEDEAAGSRAGTRGGKPQDD